MEHPQIKRALFEQLTHPIARFSPIEEYFLTIKKVGILERGATELLSPCSSDSKSHGKYDIGAIAMEDIVGKDFAVACDFIKCTITINAIIDGLRQTKDDEYTELIGSINEEAELQQQYHLVETANKKVSNSSPSKHASILEFIDRHPEIKHNIEERCSAIFTPTYTSTNGVIYIKSPEKNQTALYFGIKFDSNAPPFSLAELLWICGSLHNYRMRFEMKYALEDDRYIYSPSGVVYTGVPTILQLASGAILFSIGKQ
ncbi:MAG: hypothetical protein M0R33_15310 [Methylomonas sp.]|jgi:hypothetical protein|uniref:hypothetical protein n=1 Tax=Methylomonas sp. TaxID=418 RepID=UPI0025E01108|nr:hypothetical protein [Methylomonas sp.]MCK9607810.1 hypothetical protein [Methylomonas sp.]